VADFVPDGFRHQTAQMGGIPRGAQMRTAINRNAVGKRKAFTDATLRQRTAFIQPQQAGLARLIFHQHDDVGHAAAEGGWHQGQALFHQSLKGGARHCLFIVA